MDDLTQRDEIVGLPVDSGTEDRQLSASDAGRGDGGGMYHWYRRFVLAVVLSTVGTVAVQANAAPRQSQRI